eukprot:1156883-Pelagomonas_calceolata.AAC.4
MVEAYFFELVYGAFVITSPDLDQGQHMLRNIAHFCLHAHTLRVESSLWQEHTSDCDRCDQGGPQDVWGSSRAVHTPCHVLERLQRKQAKETYRFISKLMDIFCAAGTVEQAEQPNHLAEVEPNYLAQGQIPM